MMWAPAYKCMVNLHVEERAETPPRTNKHACQICGIRRLGDELVHGVLGTERTIELAPDGCQRAVRRLVRRATAHV